MFVEVFDMDWGLYMRVLVKFERWILLVFDIYSVIFVFVCYMILVNKLLYLKVICESELCFLGFGGRVWVL